MVGDPDGDESIFKRIGDMIAEHLQFLAPVWIVRRPESLTIIDYRPTLTMFLTGAGCVVFAGAFILFFFRTGLVDSFGLWAIGLATLGCALFLFTGTIREVYYFDKSTGSYALVRRFIHRREVIEGALDQFTGAYVKTEENDDSESHYVFLRQEGMFLTGVAEQPLRERPPIFNTYALESRIAGAISGFLQK